MTYFLKGTGIKVSAKWIYFTFRLHRSICNHFLLVQIFLENYCLFILPKVNFIFEENKMQFLRGCTRSYTYFVISKLDLKLKCWKIAMNLPKKVPISTFILIIYYVYFLGSIFHEVISSNNSINLICNYFWWVLMLFWFICK